MCFKKSQQINQMVVWVFFSEPWNEKKMMHQNYVSKKLCNYISAAYGYSEHMLCDEHTLVDFLQMSVFIFS